jgi:hypothetical protein
MMLGMVLGGDLSTSEQRVWDNFPTGKLVDFGTGNAEDDDPARGEGWGPERQVRAEVLAALLYGALEVEPGQAGEVHLARARVIGKLGLPGVTFRHRMRLIGCCVVDGIDLPEATTRTLDLHGCHVGTVHLRSAKINGSLGLSGTHLNGKDGLALDAQALTVTADMDCERLQADGRASLYGASIGGELRLRDAHLNGKDGLALNAQALTVTGSIICNRLQADGEVSLLGASIGRALVLSGAHLNGKERRALTAWALTVTADMACDGGFQADTAVDLTGAKIGRLIDERKSWPPLLRLDGLTYGDLTYMPARERLDWLNRSVDYSPQPYEQLAGYYRQLGHDEQARRVLLAKQRQRRRQRPWWTRWWGWLQDALAGYGYAPGRALLLLAGAFVAGWLVFSTHHPVPVGPGPHPAFNAALYTLDVLIPAPALGQASDFDPQGAGLAVAAGLHILGWLLAITVIAAITRSFSRT